MHWDALHPNLVFSVILYISSPHIYIFSPLSLILSPLSLFSALRSQEDEDLVHHHGSHEEG